MCVSPEESLLSTDSKTVFFFLFPGICKLINNGSYIAAFPPHEVILKYNFNLKKVSHDQNADFFFLSLAAVL